MSYLPSPSLPLSYIVTQLHGKVYPKIISRYQKENKTFHERCRDLSSHFTPSALGLPGDYSCPYKETIAKLNKLKDGSSSINKLYCLQEAMVRRRERERESLFFLFRIIFKLMFRITSSTHCVLEVREKPSTTLTYSN